MKEIIKDIINDINMPALLIGLIEVLVGAILIKITIGISATLLILGGMNIEKRTIWWKGALKVKENSIEEDIKKLRESIIEEKYHIYNKDLKITLEHILSDYKRVLKENEELKAKYDKNTHILQNQLDLANADRVEKDKILKQVYREANNILYLDDSSDYCCALWDILRIINPDLEEYPELNYIEESE